MKLISVDAQGIFEEVHRVSPVSNWVTSWTTYHVCFAYTVAHADVGELMEIMEIHTGSPNAIYHNYAVAGRRETNTESRFENEVEPRLHEHRLPLDSIIRILPTLNSDQLSSSHKRNNNSSRNDDPTLDSLRSLDIYIVQNHCKLLERSMLFLTREKYEHDTNTLYRLSLIGLNDWKVLLCDFFSAIESIVGQFVFISRKRELNWIIKTTLKLSEVHAY